MTDPVDARLVEAAKNGDAATLAALLDEHPGKLTLRAEPYEQTLLHLGASHLAVVDLLLRRGADVNWRERGDNTYAMHWAAAAGQIDVVRRLADAGGDVVGDGDDHQLEVIGWATCWEGCDDEAHRAVAEFLISRGARHHIFSAVAMNLGDEVRRIVAADPSALNRRQSRNEANRPVLHFAAAMNRPQMLALLLELGADPLAVDAMGQPVMFYASTEIDRPVLERIRGMVAAEMLSADRGNREPVGSIWDFVTLLLLGEWAPAERLFRANPVLREPGPLHLVAHRGELDAVTWVLDRGADVNGRWLVFGALVTPLHLAAARGHLDSMRLLLDRGADPAIRDTQFDSDARGWAEHFQQHDAVRLLEKRARRD